MRRKRTDEDKDMLELFLTLFKNLLQIEDPSDAVIDYYRHLHDRTIVAFHRVRALLDTPTRRLCVSNEAPSRLEYQYQIY